MHVTKLFYTGNSCQGRVNNCCIPSNFRCIMWFVDHIRGVSFWKVMKFFFLSFAFTNGNVFWSQGFYNWENLQLIQYISRFHNFTISDVKSKKKQQQQQRTNRLTRYHKLYQNIWLRLLLCRWRTTKSVQSPDNQMKDRYFAEA